MTTCKGHPVVTNEDADRALIDHYNNCADTWERKELVTAVKLAALRIFRGES